MRRKQLFAIALAGSLTMGMTSPAIAIAEEEDYGVISSEEGGDSSDFATFGDEGVEYPDWSSQNAVSNEEPAPEVTNTEGSVYTEPVPEEASYEESSNEGYYEPVFEEPDYQEPVYQEPSYTEAPAQEPPAQPTPTPETTAQEQENQQSLAQNPANALVVMSEEQLRQAIEAIPADGITRVIVVGTDLNLSSTVSVPSGKSIKMVSSVGQCMIGRNDGFTGTMFQVDGTLLFEFESADVTDSSGRFMLSGNLAGMSAEGSVVSVSGSGFFGMDESLQITGNSIGGKGAAIKSSGGILYIVGGSISGNAASDGGGVYSNGYVFVGDDAYIQGNTSLDGVTDNNVALAGSESYIVVDSSFNSGAKIGVHTAEGETPRETLVALSENASNAGVTLENIEPYIVLESESDKSTEDSDDENTENENDEENTDNEGDSEDGSTDNAEGEALKELLTQEDPDTENNENIGEELSSAPATDPNENNEENPDGNSGENPDGNNEEILSEDPGFTIENEEFYATSTTPEEEGQKEGEGEQNTVPAENTSPTEEKPQEEKQEPEELKADELSSPVQEEAMNAGENRDQKKEYTVDQSEVSGLENAVKYRPGVKHEFTVTGGGQGDQDLINSPVDGDVWWIPLTWKFNGEATEYQIDEGKGEVVFADGYNATEDRGITITLKQQTYNSATSEWVDGTTGTISNVVKTEAYNKKEHAVTESTVAGLEEAVEYKPGVSHEFTVTGAGQNDPDLEHPIDGDERWIPKTWVFDSAPSEINNLDADGKGTVVFADGHNATESLPITISLQKQTFNGGSKTWVDGETGTITANVQTKEYTKLTRSQDPAWTSYSEATVGFTVTNQSGLLQVKVYPADKTPATDPEFTFKETDPDVYKMTIDETTKKAELTVPIQDLTDTTQGYTIIAKFQDNTGYQTPTPADRSYLTQDTRPVGLILNSAVWTGTDSAKLEYTATKDGKICYIVTKKGDPAPTTYDFENGKVVTVKANTTASITLGKEELDQIEKDWVIYAKAQNKDAATDISTAVTATLTQADRPPSLEKTGGPAWRSHTTAMVKCITDKDGEYYYKWVTEDVPAEDIDFTEELKNKGIAVTANTEFQVNFTGIDDESGKKIRLAVLVRDKNGNLSKKRTDVIQEQRPAKKRDPIEHKVTESQVTGLENPVQLKPDKYYPFDVIGGGSTDEKLIKDPVDGDVKWEYSYWRMESGKDKHTAKQLGVSSKQYPDGYNKDSAIDIRIYLNKLTYNESTKTWDTTKDAGSILYTVRTASWVVRDPIVHKISETTVTGLENALEFRPGVSHSFTVIGGGERDTTISTDPVKGDVRWIPQYWVLTGDSSATQHKIANNTATVSFVNGYDKNDTLPIKIFLKQQTYSGSAWTDGATQTIDANIKTKSYSQTRNPKVYKSSDSTVSGLENPVEYKPNVTHNFTVTGAGTTDTDLTNNPVEGDVRWVPVSWKFNSDTTARPLTNGRGTVSFANGHNATENLPITITLQKQTYTGGKWENGNTETISATVKTKAYSSREPHVHVITESVVNGLEQPLELRPNVFYDFSVTGAGTNDSEINQNPVAGDTRWIPQYWIMEGGSTQQTTWKIGAPNGINADREIPIRIYLQKETYNGSEWVKGDMGFITATVRTKTYSSTTPTITPRITPGGGGGGSNVNPNPATTGSATNPYYRMLTLTPVLTGTANAAGRTTGNVLSDGARTGDDSPIGALSLLLIASLLSGGYVIVRKRKKD